MFLLRDSDLRHGGNCELFTFDDKLDGRCWLDRVACPSSSRQEEVDHINAPFTRYSLLGSTGGSLLHHALDNIFPIRYILRRATTASTSWPC